MFFYSGYDFFDEKLKKGVLNCHCLKKLAARKSRKRCIPPAEWLKHHRPESI